MAIPTWSEFMVPVLRVLTDGEVHGRRELFVRLAETERLSDAEKLERLSSGAIKYENRISWATSFLKRAGALNRPRKGQYVITDIGRGLLADHPDGISGADLRALPTYEQRSSGRAASTAAGPTVPGATLDAEADATPAEQVARGIARIHEDVAADILTRILDKEPSFFESAVIRLLVAMGYGGADGAARVTPQSNDGGIDGIIDQDALGLDQVYIQAKRYADGNNVGREAIQAFIGALHGVGASRGVFITSSMFTQGAREYAEAIPTRIVLIDGTRLTDLMIKYRVGVQVQETYHIVEIDEDFFE